MKQFNESKGYLYADIDSVSYMREFEGWMNKLIENKNIYQDLLRYNNIEINYPTIAEVGKGLCDSIAMPETKIISPFGDTLGDEVKDLIVYCGEPIVLDSKKRLNEYILKFITQNPYEQRQIRQWPTLKNSGFDLCVGMFGDLSDKDYVKKMKCLSEFYKSLPEDLDFTYETHKNTYLAYVNTKEQVLEKQKIIKL